MVVDATSGGGTPNDKAGETVDAAASFRHGGRFMVLRNHKGGKVMDRWMDRNYMQILLIHTDCTFFHVVTFITVLSFFLKKKRPNTLLHLFLFFF